MWRCLKTIRIIHIELAGHGVKFTAGGFGTGCNINEAHHKSPTRSVLDLNRAFAPYVVALVGRSSKYHGWAEGYIDN